MSARKSLSRSGSEGTSHAAEASVPAARSWRITAGLSGLLVWLVGGGVLEALHGFKAPAYLQDELRREMWTLAHAHGTLLSLACLVLAGLPSNREQPPRARVRADRLFAAGAVLLPLGFLLGGVWHTESDPGLGILLVPAGGILAAAGLVTMLAARRRGASET